LSWRRNNFVVLSGYTRSLGDCVGHNDEGETMTRARNLTIATAASLLIALLAACSNGSNPDTSLVAKSGLGTEEGPIGLTADPQEVVIDLNDPETPVDPGTQEAYGEATLTATVRDELGDPLPDAEVVFSSTGGTLASGGEPVLTDAEGKASDVLRLLESDPESVDVTATVGEDSETITVTKTVIALNGPPVADAGPDQDVECGEQALLDGSASSDPDSTPGTNDDIERFEWLLGEQVLGEGETLALTLPLGMHVITLRVTDKAGATDTDETTVRVADNRPPEVTVALDPWTIWPPNHKMVDVTATVTISDTCPSSPTPPVVTLLSVTSDEPENDLGDGDTAPDIAGVEAGTEDYEFQVRAERSGGGDGRVYTALYRVTDASGNVAEAEGRATVPHDQRLDMSQPRNVPLLGGGGS
jgi:hypothetical protein